MIFGIAPAYQAVKTDLIAGLRSAGLSSSARRRTLGRNALVIGQLALSMVLLVAAGMIFDGFRKALVMNPGYRTDHLMLMEFDTRLVRYADDESRIFYRNVVDRSDTPSGVRSVALGQAVPMTPPISPTRTGDTRGLSICQRPGNFDDIGLDRRQKFLLRHHENAGRAWARFHSCR